METLITTYRDRFALMSESHDQRQFVELVDAHGAAILGTLRKLCGNGHDADDVFQETAVRVWRSFSNRPVLRNPRAWLMTIAYRSFVDHRARRLGHSDLEDSPDRRVQTPDRQAEHAENCQLLRDAVSELPEAIRQVVILHYSGGLTLRQTAEAMCISEGTVKSRLNSALGKLRSVLA